MERISSAIKTSIPSGVVCLLAVFALFGYLGNVMGTSFMMKTLMATAHDLLINTCFFLMAVCVVTGAIGSLFMEFGVVRLFEKLLRPLMKPVFRLPGVASLGAVMTFLSDNPAIITLSRDKRFSAYFKKFQFISLTNFGTAFGMGLLVIVFMIGQGFIVSPLIGFTGAIVGCITSTRIMQGFVLRAYPAYRDEDVVSSNERTETEEEEKKKSTDTLFTRILNSLLDGGKNGVEVGVAIIPGVLIISSIVMMLTFGAGPDGAYDGSAYQGVELLPALAGKINFIFQYMFGFEDPHLIGFPITTLGAVGAALGLVPRYISEGWIDGNAIAVFTAIGMC
ncbi:MAG: hypothetical protein K2L69_01575, partial [Muribaculaceae bacterium]|nr:hypothetical protein [Muribaculaceae bacterium]